MPNVHAKARLPFPTHICTAQKRSMKPMHTSITATGANKSAAAADTAFPNQHRR